MPERDPQLEESFFLDTEQMKIRYAPGEQIDLTGLRAFLGDREVTDECFVSAGHRFWPEDTKSIRVRVRLGERVETVKLYRKVSMVAWVVPVFFFLAVILLIYATAPMWPDWSF